MKTADSNRPYWESLKTADLMAFPDPFRANEYSQPGMTILEYYVGQALAGLLAAKHADRFDADAIAEDCVSYAWALCAALDARKEAADETPGECKRMKIVLDEKEGEER